MAAGRGHGVGAAVTDRGAGMRMILLGSAAAAAVLAAAGGASAESRLVSARTNQAGIEVASAVRDGVDLPVAGQGGGVTFFRIETPDGPVPCANQIRFTTSDGQLFDVSADLCARNWEVTITLGPPSSQPSSPPAARPDDGPAGAAGGRTVTIRTDDPAVAIEEVLLGGLPVPIAGRAGGAVEIAVSAGAGAIVCERDLGLVLSDGRRLARAVDICADNGRVLVALAASAGADAAPAPPGPPGGPDVVDTMQWIFLAGPERADLVYGIPETDAGEFHATCAPRSGAVTVVLERTAPEVQPGAPVPVALATTGFARSYTAVGSEVSALSGRSHPEFAIETADPLWPALIAEEVLTVSIGARTTYALSLRGSAVKARQFLAACNPLPVVVTPGGGVAPGFAPPPFGEPFAGPPPVGPTPVAPPPPPPVGPGLAGPVPPGLPGPPPPGSAPSAPVGPGYTGPGVVGPGQRVTTWFACDDGSTLTVTFDPYGSTAVLAEAGARAIVLLSAPGFAGQRWVAGGSELAVSGANATWLRAGGFPRACALQN
jgi:hypothetical protein